MKAMRALADDDRTVVAGILALGACALEVHTADTACVVRVFGQIPLPGCDRFEGVDGDLHTDRG